MKPVSAISLFFINLLLFNTVYANSDLSSVYEGNAMEKVCATVVEEDSVNKGRWRTNSTLKAFSAEGVFVAKRESQSAVWTISFIPTNDPDQILLIQKFKSKIKGIAYNENKIWVLFSNRLISMDSKSGDLLTEAKSHTYNEDQTKHYAAHDLAIH